MDRFHKYEFVRTRRSMHFQLVTALLSHSIILANLINSVWSRFLIKWMCQSPESRIEEFQELSRPRQIWLFFTNNLFIAQTLICFTIIKLKSSQDILQGISKLDYLLKVSIFQVYKDKTLRKRQLTLGSTHTFIRDESEYDLPFDDCTTLYSQNRPSHLTIQGED